MTESKAFFSRRRAAAKLALAAMHHTTGAAGLQTLLIQIVGEIGPGKSASVVQIRKQLAQAPAAKAIRLVVNSRGGCLDQAFRLFSLIREQPARVSAIVIYCCSAAVLPLLAADHRSAKPNARLMIHGSRLDPRVMSDRPWTADRHRLAAGLLTAADNRILDLLAQRT